MFLWPHFHEIIVIENWYQPLIQKIEVNISNLKRFHNELVQSK